MDEKIIAKLVDYIKKHITDTAVIQVEIEKCFQALEWAEQKQQWNLIIEVADTLSFYFLHSRAVDLKMEEQNPEQIALAMRDFWEQGRQCFTCGLLAAKHANQDEVPFLAHLSRLSSYLVEFSVALDYFKQELQLVHPEVKWRTVREVHLLGIQAMDKGDLLVARECYQTSLEEWEKLDNKYAMAEVLAWMAVNEERLNNLDTAKQLFEQSDELKRQLSQQA